MINLKFFFGVNELEMRNSGVRILIGGGGGLYIVSFIGIFEGINGVGIYCRVGVF